MAAQNFVRKGLSKFDLVYKGVRNITQKKEKRDITKTLIENDAKWTAYMVHVSNKSALNN